MAQLENARRRSPPWTRKGFTCTQRGGEELEKKRKGKTSIKYMIK